VGAKPPAQDPGGEVKGDGERLLVKIGLGELPRPMTREQARRYGERHMPRDLKAAGFNVVISKSDAIMHGGVWFRINYGK
jgi:hypothetical protein